MRFQFSYDLPDCFIIEGIVMWPEQIPVTVRSSIIHKPISCEYIHYML